MTRPRQPTVAAQWRTNFPDPTERAAWRAHFEDDARRANLWRQRFTDPEAARAWSRIYPLIPGWAAAYLHRHGIAADHDLITGTIHRARAEGNAPGRPSTRVCLLLAHPTLTVEDRDAILTAGLTPVEVDHLITDGTFNRGSLTLLAALT